MKGPDPEPPSLDALQSLLASARELIDELAGSPNFGRLVTVFSSFPDSDRETILRVLERDATWRRIASDVAPLTGITVHPNPHASLYMHVLDEPGPSARDVEVIRLGIERLFLPLLPLFFQEGVHEQWMRSARELVRAADSELRALGVRLAHEILALIAEVDAANGAKGR
jgi:hypothetical protein